MTCQRPSSPGRLLTSPTAAPRQAPVHADVHTRSQRSKSNRGVADVCTHGGAPVCRHQGKHRAPLTAPSSRTLAPGRTEVSSGASAHTSTSLPSLPTSFCFQLPSRHSKARGPSRPRARLHLSYVRTVQGRIWTWTILPRDLGGRVNLSSFWPACPLQGPALELMHERSWVTAFHPHTFSPGRPRTWAQAAPCRPGAACWAPSQTEARRARAHRPVAAGEPALKPLYSFCAGPAPRIARHCTQATHPASLGFWGRGAPGRPRHPGGGGCARTVPCIISRKLCRFSEPLSAP